MSLVEKIFGTGKKAVYAELMLIFLFLMPLLFLASIIYNMIKLANVIFIIAFLIECILGVYYSEEKDKETISKAKHE